MKAKFIFVFAVLAGLFSGTAGGQVSSFMLLNFQFPEAPIFDAEGVPLGPDFRVELWGSSMPESLVPAYHLRTGDRLILSFLGDGYEGYFASGAEAIVPAQFVNGGNSWLQVRAWDSRLGVTYEEVAALDVGGYGESSLFYADGANPFQFGAPEHPRPLVGLESFNLRAVVPEPSTWALLALGALALIWTRPGRRR